MALEQNEANGKHGSCNWATDRRTFSQSWVNWVKRDNTVLEKYYIISNIITFLQP